MSASTRDSAVTVIGVFSSLVVVAAAFMPWVELGPLLSLSGTDVGDGETTTILGIGAALAFLAAWASGATVRLESDATDGAICPSTLQEGASPGPPSGSGSSVGASVTEAFPRKANSVFAASPEGEVKSGKP